MTVSSVWNIIYQFNNTMVIGMASKLLEFFSQLLYSTNRKNINKNISELGRDSNYRTCNDMKYFCSEYNIMCS